MLVYEHRIRSVRALLREGRRWSHRELIVHGHRRVTFAEHEAAAGRAADLFAARGVRPGDRVALFAANSAEWSVAFFAALELGAMAVPCNGWWSASEVAHACDATRPTLLVADADRIERVPDDIEVLPLQLLTRALDDPSETPRTGLGDVPEEDEDQPAAIVFTSGTTGFPKGATLSHRSLIANIHSLRVVSHGLPHQISDDQPPTVTMVSLPLFHIGAIQLLLMPFVSGGRLVFPKGRFDAAEVLDAVADEGVTMWSAVPTMVERVLAEPRSEKRNLTSLRTIVLGGAPVSSSLLERLSQAFPNARRGVGQAYGLTEAGGVLATGVAKSTRPGSSGRIVPVAEIRIDQPDDDGVGEIQARSPAVMDSYWGLPNDPVFTPDGWLRTGDLGRVDEDRFLFVTGRHKDMIIRGGENIAPAHIEACLLEHAEVREAAVVGLPHAELGEEVGAVVVVPDGSPTDAEQLEALLRARLAHFEVPSRWWIRHDELPKSDTGKVLKQQLREDWQRMAE